MKPQKSNKMKEHSRKDRRLTSDQSLAMLGRIIELECESSDLLEQLHCFSTSDYGVRGDISDIMRKHDFLLNAIKKLKLSDLR